MEDEEELRIRRDSSLSLSIPGPMVSATVGRVMNTLLNAKPKKLQNAISRLNSPPKIAAVQGSLEQSLWFLQKCICEAAEKHENLDQVLVPMIQQSLKLKETKHGNQAVILLNWLFQDEILFVYVVENLCGIISRKDDRHVALAWCILGRTIIEYESCGNNLETDGIREKYIATLKMFLSCVNHLLSVVCNGSHMHEGFELPTRLALAAADFILSLTKALTTNNPASNNIIDREKSSVSAKKQLNTLLRAANSEKDVNTLGKSTESPSSLELKFLLWSNLDELMTLVKGLTAWSLKSRSLHAKGLDRVFQWLQGIRQQYGCLKTEADTEMVKTGSLLLSSCWKHYGMLLHLQDPKFSHKYKELLEQYLSGVQFYADNQVQEPNTSKDSRTETINFFLNCLLLLLGRLDNQQFGNAITEFGSHISQLLVSQLQCNDEEVIDGIISLFKAVIFRTNHISSKISYDDTTPVDSVLPLLLNLLDEQDTAAKAVVKLVAEYCSICSDTKCLQEVLKRIDSKNVAQRRNAVEVLAELIRSSNSGNELSHAVRLDVGNHLLKCLGDEDWIIQNQAINLIPVIDPTFILPALVRLCYSKEERIKLTASTTLTALLINHKQNPEIICILLDCLSNLCQKPDVSGGTKEGITFDANVVLQLLPEWAKKVEDWNALAGSLIEKMLSEPSNAVIVRFLSRISEYLAEAADLIFGRLMFYTKRHKVIDEPFCVSKGSTDANIDAVNSEHSLFSHLCPLLVIKLLPLRVLDDLTSTLVYGEFMGKSDTNKSWQFSIESTDCIASLLINRALSKSGFEEVRKLAAELCGRLHHKVLIPIMSSHLEYASNTRDASTIKICLFSICTSLMVRGSKACRHPDLVSVRKTIQKILCWPSVSGDQISNAQHGCIDCLAWMLCSEVQDSESLTLANLEKISGRNFKESGDTAFIGSVLAHVIKQLTGDATVPLRLCMANVLISACQKISANGKKPFVEKIIPRIIRALEAIVEPEIRAACIQVLFSVAYHLKYWVLPYSHDLLNVSLRSLREGSPKEKMAGAKLLACLMSSEDVVENVTDGLLEARELLQNLSLNDTSLDVRQMCQQLLLCLTSQ